MMNIRCYFLTVIVFCFSFYFIVKAAYQQNHNRNKNNHHTNNRIASNQRSLQQTLNFTLTTKITASYGGTDNNFGGFNALAISNNRIVVGANGQGAAYLFMDPNDPESGRSYSQMATLTVGGDQFGTSIDIDGDIIVVGATEEYSVGPGSIYIFRIGDNTNISQIAKITAQNGVTYDNFGRSVAIRGNFILVGAPWVDVNGSLVVGSAYLFVNRSNDPNTPDWTQIMRFQPNDLTESDYFGISVAMEDQIAVIGTSDSLDANAAYVFGPVDEDNLNSLSLWTQMAKLMGPTGSGFGSSVAVAGIIMVVGAPFYRKNNGNNAGAVFVFTKIDGSSSTSSSSSAWTQTNILLAADGAQDDQFGISVSISKDASTIVVGANYDDYNSTVTNLGAAYLFRNSNTTTTTTVGWTQVGKYVTADRDTDDNLGISIAIENSVMVVGAPGDDFGTGSVYILNTDNSPPPPTTPVPTQTPTTEPTAEPIVPTFQPTSHPTTKPTGPPTTYPPTTMAPDNDNSDNLSSPPTTLTPTKDVPTASKPMSPSNSTTSTPRESPTTTESNNNNVIISATVVLGVVVAVVALGFFNYRLKRDRLLLVEQQQQQQTPLPPPSPWNNGMAAVNTDETPIMANAVFPDQSAEERTMPAEAFVDPPQTHAPPPAAVAANIVNMDLIDAEKGLPEFKDQTRNATPPVGPSAIPPAGPIRNSQRNRDHPQHQDREEELPGTQEVQQQQQQQLRDSPAAINL